MLKVYDAPGGRLQACGVSDIADPRAIWIDLLNPTDEEDSATEAAIKIDVPTRSEMREIEASNRFYTENGAIYMTALVLHHDETGVLKTSPITFILAGKRLVTVRYAEPKAFELYLSRAAKPGNGCRNGAEVMAGLIETIIGREADLIERLQDDVETTAPRVFAQHGSRKPASGQLAMVLSDIGKAGDIVGRAQESANSVNRLLHYAAAALRARKEEAALMDRCEAAIADIASLIESLRFLSARIAFLLDATLGLISNEQNQIIKLFSVMAVVLMPPTLIASIYGMNFDYMPELRWPHGYWIALAAMVVAAIAPYLYFRSRGWF